MTKKLFISILPLASWSSAFHELSIIFESDSIIKCAYQFKLKLESNGYENSLINSQGYSLEEIKSNPQYSYECYNEVLRILDTYINKSLEKDKCTLYCWEESDAIKFVQFMSDNGCREIDKYFFSGYVGIKSLLIEKCQGNLENYDPMSLEELSEAFLKEKLQRDSFNRITNMYKIYKSI